MLDAVSLHGSKPWLTNMISFLEGGTCVMLSHMHAGVTSEKSIPMSWMYERYKHPSVFMDYDIKQKLLHVLISFRQDQLKLIKSDCTACVRTFQKLFYQCKKAELCPQICRSGTLLSYIA